MAFGEDAAASRDDPLVDAALRCFARWGVAKTSLDDLAREARCSRATVYRAFPGGKDALVAAVAVTEVGRFLRTLQGALAEAESLEDALVAGIHTSTTQIAAHQPLQFLFAHEPELLLPHLAFARMDDLLAFVSAFVAPVLERWLPAEDALRAGEWATRLVISYSCCPSDSVDATDPVAVRHLVRTFVLPGLAAAVPV